jgi:hypothetical protein
LRWAARRVDRGVRQAAVEIVGQDDELLDGELFHTLAGAQRRAEEADVRRLVLSDLLGVEAKGLGLERHLAAADDLPEQAHPADVAIGEGRAGGGAEEGETPEATARRARFEHLTRRTEWGFFVQPF